MVLVSCYLIQISDITIFSKKAEGGKKNLKSKQKLEKQLHGKAIVKHNPVTADRWVY